MPLASLRFENQQDEVPDTRLDDDFHPTSLGFVKFCRILGNMLQLEATTWVRDSHELFDYESRSVEKANFSIESSFRIYRRGVNVFLGPDRDGGM